MRYIEKTEDSDLFFIVLGLLGFIFAFCMAMFLFCIGDFALAFLFQLLMIVMFYCTCMNIIEYNKERRWVEN